MDTGSTTGGALGRVRACALAVVAVLTASLAHVAAGGALPSAAALTALGGVVAVGAAPLLRRPASGLRVVLLLSGGEMVLHVALGWLAPGHGHAMSSLMSGPMSGPMSGRMLGAMSGPMPAPLQDPSSLMAQGHLVAALVVGLWLAAGERALWALLSLSARPFRRAWSAWCGSPVVTGGRGLPARPRTDALDGERRPSGMWALACRVVTHRGPPAAATHPLAC